MARRRTTTRKSTAARTGSTRRTSTARKRTKTNGKVANFIVPLFLIACLLLCLSFLVLFGYQTVTASTFFDLKSVAVEGASAETEGEIKEIVRRNSLVNGVWRADVAKIKTQIESLRDVRRASVSRILPDEIYVNVELREPAAIVRLDGADYWVDKDGLILNVVGKNEKRPEFTMFGWDRNRSESATEENRRRIQIFNDLRTEWQRNSLISRVRAVDLSDPGEPKAIVSDSGKAVTIVLGLEDKSRALQKGIESVVGRGKEVQAVIITNDSPVIEYRNS
ncbi:MAG: cell division protein FtsQ/DivIB [Pyrinomonadaceae bacterium]